MSQWKEKITKQAELARWREQVAACAVRGELHPVDVAMLLSLIHI